MPGIKKIISYAQHYGIKSALGLAREKFLIDKKRFSPDKKREMPNFSKGYKHAEIPTCDSSALPINVMYLIHYFYPSKKGGTERFTLNLAKEQQKLGNFPIVLVLEANEAKSIYTHSFGNNILYRYYEYEGIPCIAFRHKKAPYGLYYKNINLDDESMKQFAAFIIKKHTIDIVHATYPQPFASFLCECKRLDIPYVCTCTDFCMMCHYSTMVDNNGDFCCSSEGGERCRKMCKSFGCRDFALRKENAETVLSGAEIVTVPSEFVANMLDAEFPEVAFIPVSHGLSDAFEFSERTGPVKKFVYAGTLTPLKGVHLLISAFESINDDKLTLDIYGEGDESYVSSLRELAGQRVTFHGAVPGSEMPRVYSEADCVIVPSMWYETYNFVLREALMTGALVLASDIGAMPEAVSVGENGFLFTPADRNSLENAMKEAINFDFSGYKKGAFPTVENEAITYYSIYYHAKKGENKA